MASGEVTDLASADCPDKYGFDDVFIYVLLIGFIYVLLIGRIYAWNLAPAAAAAPGRNRLANVIRRLLELPD
jgi:hypothetical protein